MVDLAAKPRAFSYLRFSTPEQAAGDSFRRQTALAEEYCARNGLDLDRALTFQDLGVSAFRGKNAEVGKLAEFLDAVKVGLVPQGSFFLVESLDRVSRKAARKALRTLEDIVETGVSVVTLIDGKVYSEASLDEDPTALLMSILIFMRSHEESQTKSRRLLAAWDNKKKLAASEKKPLTARTPAWIALNKETGHYELIPAKAKVVKWIFKKTIAGMGRGSIAKQLNQDNVPVLGNGGKRVGRMWYESYIAKILANPSTCGVCIPHAMFHTKAGKKIRKPLEPIYDYFPKVVTAEEFKEVAMLMESKNPQRGRHATKGPASIISGLMRCPKCESVMTRVVKGKKGGVPRLVCVKAKAGDGCEYHAVRLPPIEAAIFERLHKVLNDPPTANDVDNKEVDTLSTSIDVMEEGISTLLDDFAKTGSAAVREKIREYEEKMNEAKARFAGLREWQEVSGGPLLYRSTTEAQTQLLSDKPDTLAINLSLRKLFSGIVVNYDGGTLIFRWKNGQESEVFYAFPEDK